MSHDCRLTVFCSRQLKQKMRLKFDKLHKQMFASPLKQTKRQKKMSPGLQTCVLLQEAKQHVAQPPVCLRGLRLSARRSFTRICWFFWWFLREQGARRLVPPKISAQLPVAVCHSTLHNKSESLWRKNPA